VRTYRDQIDWLPVTADDEARLWFERHLQSYIGFGWTVVERHEYPPAVRITYAPTNRDRIPSGFVKDRVLRLSSGGDVVIDPVEDM